MIGEILFALCIVPYCLAVPVPLEGDLTSNILDSPAPMLLSGGIATERDELRKLHLVEASRGCGSRPVCNDEFIALFKQLKQQTPAPYICSFISKCVYCLEQIKECPISHWKYTTILHQATAPFESQCRGVVPSIIGEQTLTGTGRGVVPSIIGEQALTGTAANNQSPQLPASPVWSPYVQRTFDIDDSSEKSDNDDDSEEKSENNYRNGYNAVKTIKDDEDENSKEEKDSKDVEYEIPIRRGYQVQYKNDDSLEDDTFDILDRDDSSEDDKPKRGPYNLEDLSLTQYIPVPLKAQSNKKDGLRRLKHAEMIRGCGKVVCRQELWHLIKNYKNKSSKLCPTTQHYIRCLRRDLKICPLTLRKNFVMMQKVMSKALKTCSIRLPFKQVNQMIDHYIAMNPLNEEVSIAGGKLTGHRSRTLDRSSSEDEDNKSVEKSSSDEDYETEYKPRPRSKAVKATSGSSQEDSKENSKELKKEYQYKTKKGENDSKPGSNERDDKDDEEDSDEDTSIWDQKKQNYRQKLPKSSASSKDQSDESSKEEKKDGKYNLKPVSGKDKSDENSEEDLRGKKTNQGPLNNIKEITKSSEESSYEQMRRDESKEDNSYEDDFPKGLGVWSNKKQQDLSKESRDGSDESSLEWPKKRVWGRKTHRISDSGEYSDEEDDKFESKENSKESYTVKKYNKIRTWGDSSEEYESRDSSTEDYYRNTRPTGYVKNKKVKLTSSEKSDSIEDDSRETTKKNNKVPWLKRLDSTEESSYETSDEYDNEWSVVKGRKGGLRSRSKDENDSADSKESQEKDGLRRNKLGSVYKGKFEDDSTFSGESYEKGTGKFRGRKITRNSDANSVDDDDEYGGYYESYEKDSNDVSKEGRPAKYYNAIKSAKESDSSEYYEYSKEYDYSKELDDSRSDDDYYKSNNKYSELGRWKKVKKSKDSYENEVDYDESRGYEEYEDSIEGDKITGSKVWKFSVQKSSKDIRDSKERNLDSNEDDRKLFESRALKLSPIFKYDLDEKDNNRGKDKVMNVFKDEDKSQEKSKIFKLKDVHLFSKE